MIGNKTVAITYGSYDPLHYGHINLFRRIKEFADILIVGVATQHSHDVWGTGKVLMFSLEDRMKAVKECDLVDKVIIEDEKDQYIPDIINNNVDFYVMGSDYTGKKDWLKPYCKVIYLPRTEGICSSDIKKKIRGEL